MDFITPKTNVWYYRYFSIRLFFREQKSPSSQFLFNNFCIQFSKVIIIWSLIHFSHAEISEGTE